MPLGLNNKDRIEKDRKGSDWIGSQILFQDGKRIGSDCRSIFDKRIGIGSQIQKKRIVQFSASRLSTCRDRKVHIASNITKKLSGSTKNFNQIKSFT